MRVVADGDRRRTEERRAGDVQLAGNRLLRLPEAASAVPRVVRVAQQQTAAVSCGVTVEGDRVRPHGRLVGPLAHRPDQGVGVRDGPAVLAVGGGSGGRLCAGDVVHGAALTAEYGDGVEAGCHIQRGDRPHPGGALAGRVGDRFLLQPGVVPGREAPHEVLDLAARAARRRFSEELLHRAGLPYAAEVQVAGEVPGRRGQREVARRVGSEEPRTLAPHGHEPVGECAHLVGGLRPSGTEAERLVVLGDDVRNAVLGIADDGGQTTVRESFLPVLPVLPVLRVLPLGRGRGQ